ncbi:MAG: Smr/MutS family protein [Deltaproteobacteria bacterium]|nr:Smr/MutS family protein [Deltaproteobacteria bacterium]
MPFSKNDFNNSPFEALAGLRVQLLEKVRLKAQKEHKAKSKSKGEAANSAQKSLANPTDAARPMSEGEEQWLFAQEMADVTPLKDPAKRLPPEPPTANSFKSLDPPNEDALVLEALNDLVEGRIEFDLRYSDEYVEGKAKDLSPEDMDKLRLGQIPYQDVLDLHELSLSQAEVAIEKFVLKSISLRRACVLLVHGRGHRSKDKVPVLKRNLENLLLRSRIRKRIQAFVTAQPVDGGPGSSYVLLRW